MFGMHKRSRADRGERGSGSVSLTARSATGGPANCSITASSRAATRDRALLRPTNATAPGYAPGGGTGARLAQVLEHVMGGDILTGARRSCRTADGRPSALASRPRRRRIQGECRGREGGVITSRPSSSGRSASVPELPGLLGPFGTPLARSVWPGRGRSQSIRLSCAAFVAPQPGLAHSARGSTHERA